MEEKDLKTRIQEKLNKRIEGILSKSELTDDDFRILEARLLMLRTEEAILPYCGGLSSTSIEQKED